MNYFPYVIIDRIHEMYHQLMMRNVKRDIIYYRKNRDYDTIKQI
jgi:hypothetical protein